MPTLRFVAILFIGVAPCFAADPDVQTLNVRGLQIGGTTSITIDGDRLGANPRLFLPFAAKSTLNPGATDKKIIFDVSLDDTVPPGYHHLRVVTDRGISLPQIIGTERMPQRAMAASIEQLPYAITGNVTGSTVAETTFAGKTGQKVMIEIEAKRLGSKLRPVMHLYGPKRVQVAWSWPAPQFADDTRFEATLPTDGTYTIAIHHLEYAGQNPGFFRMKIGQWSTVDQVFPPVVGKSGGQVELLGSGARTKVDVPAKAWIAMLPWPKEGVWSGPRPMVAVSDITEVIEQLSSAKPQELPATPVGVSGRLSTPTEQDVYRLSVTPNTRIRLEVFAERVGSPIDTAIVVRNDKDADLARAEDSPGTLDPVLEYAVPDKVTAIQVAVIDSQGRGSSRGIYRLVVEPVQTGGDGDFRLFTPTQRVSLRAGGRGVVPVYVDRRGYQGPIDLVADGLPNGVKLKGNRIEPGADGTLVTITGMTAGAAITNWRGRATNGREAPVMLRGHPLEQLQPWLANELAMAVTSSKADEFAIDWKGLDAKAGLSPGGKLALPVAVKRPDPNTVARLTLLTSQNPPMNNNQPNQNATIRLERETELAVKVSDGNLPIVLPPDLPADFYDIAVQAEILAADRRTVLARVVTPVKRLPVKIPIAIKLDGPPRIEAKLDAKTGATVEIPGQVERRDDFKGDVALTVTGLPPGVRAEPLTVKAGTNTFKLKLVFPANGAAGETKSVKLTGTVSPDPKQPNQRVRSRDVELTLVVLAAKK